MLEYFSPLPNIFSWRTRRLTCCGRRGWSTSTRSWWSASRTPGCGHTSASSYSPSTREFHYLSHINLPSLNWIIHVSDEWQCYNHHLPINSLLLLTTNLFRHFYQWAFTRFHPSVKFMALSIKHSNVRWPYSKYRAEHEHVQTSSNIACISKLNHELW